MAAHRGEVCKKGRVCRCRKCCKSCVCYGSSPAASGRGMQLPRLEDPPAPSSKDSVFGMILGGICTVVVVVFKILWVMCQIVIAIMGWCLVMDWLSGRDDR